MNSSLSLSVHAWRGIGPDVEPDLFFWRWRFGFVTLTVCRVCVLSTYWQLKNRVDALKAEAHNAKREAERLRATIKTAVEITGEGR